MGNKQQKFKYNSEEVVYDESKSSTENFDKDEYFKNQYSSPVFNNNFDNGFKDGIKYALKFLDKSYNMDESTPPGFDVEDLNSTQDSIGDMSVNASIGSMPGDLEDLSQDYDGQRDEILGIEDPGRALSPPIQPLEEEEVLEAVVQVEAEADQEAQEIAQPVVEAVADVVEEAEAEADAEAEALAESLAKTTVSKQTKKKDRKILAAPRRSRASERQQAVKENKARKDFADQSNMRIMNRARLLKKLLSGPRKDEKTEDEKFILKIAVFLNKFLGDLTSIRDRRPGGGYFGQAGHSSTPAEWSDDYDEIAKYQNMILQLDDNSNTVEGIDFDENFINYIHAAAIMNPPNMGDREFNELINVLETIFSVLDSFFDNLDSMPKRKIAAVAAAPPTLTYSPPSSQESDTGGGGGPSEGTGEADATMESQSSYGDPFAELDELLMDIE